MTNNSAPSEIVPAQRQLSLFDVVSLLVGIVVGVSIFQVPSQVFDLAGHPWLALALWGIGGLLALCGALCYAELAGTWPRFGAEYVFLSKTFGSKVGFLFAWMTLVAILPANIGAAAYVATNYASRIFPELELASGILPALLIFLLSSVQMTGFAAGRWTQNILTCLKILSIGLVLICGITQPAAPEFLTLQATPPALAWEQIQWANVGLALVFVMYAYGGWNDVAAVTPEVANCGKNIPRALCLGLIFVATIYLTLNLLYLRVLGPDAVRLERAPASAVVAIALGDSASRFASLMIFISALGAINGMMFAACRLLAAAGTDFPAFRKWAVWNSSQVPVWSLLTISCISLLMVWEVEHYWIYKIATSIMSSFGVAAADWDRFGGGFQLLVATSAPVFWAFIIMTCISVFLARHYYPDIERSFRMPLYPLPALLFLAISGYMFWSSLRYAGLAIVVMLPALLFGLVLLCVAQTKQLPEESSEL